MRANTFGFAVGTAAYSTNVLARKGATLRKTMTNPSSAIEHPIYPLIADFLTWLAPLVEKFPRSQRFILGNRMLDSAYWCQRDLIRARKVQGPTRADALLSADVELEVLRQQLRTAHDMRCISTRQYEHGAGLLNQIGGLLGSWRN